MTEPSSLKGVVRGIGMRGVRLYDEQDNRVNVDRISESLGVIDVLHHRTHQGVVFDRSHTFAGVLAGNDVDILLQVPAEGPPSHAQVEVNSGASATVTFFEGTTFSDPGTALTPVNRNRISSKTAVLLVSHTPVVTMPGTELISRFIPSGQGAQAAGGSSSFEEYILNFGTNYLLRITNEGAQAENINIILTWYEPDLADPS